MFIAKMAAVASALSLALIPSAASADVDEPATVSFSQGVKEDSGAVVFTGEQSELTVLPSKADEVPAEELALLAPSISCKLGVHHVHPSHHVSGNINGTAKIQCTGKAASLTLHYSLIRVDPKPKQWGAPVAPATNKAYVQNNRAVSCKEGPGDFRGWAQGVIVPPKGYKLVGPATYKKYGDIMPIACGSPTFAAMSDESGEVTTSVRFVREDLVK